jgi:hypothetical protein
LNRFDQSNALGHFAKPRARPGLSNWNSHSNFVLERAFQYATFKMRLEAIAALDKLKEGRVHPRGAAKARAVDFKQSDAAVPEPSREFAPGLGRSAGMTVWASPISSLRGATRI